MKAIVLTDNGIDLQDVILEALSLNYVRIRVAGVGLCGSDVTKILGLPPPPSHTRILGHEFYGQVIECNGLTQGVSVGDWVVGMPIVACGMCLMCRHKKENLRTQAHAIGRTVRGAFAEFVDVPISNAVRINSHDLRLEHYILTDPLAVCVHANNLIDFSDTSQHCLIIGDGTIGCLLALLLHMQGRDVLVKGAHERNLEFMEGFGIKTATTAIPHDHFDVVYETVGRAQPNTLNESLEAIRRGGTVIVLGVFAYNYSYPLIARDLFVREVRLMGSNAYIRSEFDEAVRLVQMHRDTLRSFISHYLPLSQFENALKLARKKQGFTMKICLSSQI